MKSAVNGVAVVICGTELGVCFELVGHIGVACNHFCM